MAAQDEKKATFTVF